MLFESVRRELALGGGLRLCEREVPLHDLLREGEPRLVRVRARARARARVRVRARVYG